jgi:hypothetical protein
VDAAHFGIKLPFVVLVAALLIFGCFPRLLTDKINFDAERIVSAFKSDNHNAPGKTLVVQSVR